MKEKTLNIQTEHLENQMARFTVEVDDERMEQAKRAAAKQLARRYNIPGFRKGKAPYRILVQNGLEPQIIYDAVEKLSQEIYREMIEQSDLDPYGPGTFEDFKAEPAPTFIYTVPLQPVIALNDYRSVRLEFEKPEVDDEALTEAMKRLQQQEALVEESHKPAELGNRLTVDIHSTFADAPPQDAALADEEVAEAEEEAEEHDHEHDAPGEGTTFIHEHDAQVILDPEGEPILPGFNAAMVGANEGDTVEFELTVPDDDSEYEDIAGRKIKFSVDVKKIEVITLPELNDDLAARVTQDEEEPLTLLQLRLRMRETMQEELERRAKDAYAARVIDEMVDQAEIAYPPAMVDDQIEDMIEDLSRRLGQQGMNLDTYFKVTNTTREMLQEQYRENAEDAVKRSLVMREVVSAEKLSAPEEKINERIENMLKQFGEQAESIRSVLDTPNMRASIANDLLQGEMIERLVAIGIGEAPDLAELEQVVDAESSAAAEDEAADDNEETEVEETAEVAAEESTVDDKSEQD